MKIHDMTPFVDRSKWERLDFEIKCGLGQVDLHPFNVCHYRYHPETFLTTGVALKKWLEMDEAARQEILRGRPEPRDMDLFMDLTFGSVTTFSFVHLRDTVDGLKEHNRRAEFCRWSEEMEFFPGLKLFLESLPVGELGRVSLGYIDHHMPIELHSDCEPGNHSEEFLLLCGSDMGRLYLESDGNRINQPSPVVYFDHGFYHGVESSPFASYFIKVECQFSEQWRRELHQ